MKAKTVWKEKMHLVGEADGHFVDLDAKSPIGNGSGLTPKELVALGVCGCTAMDVVSLLRKYRQTLESLEVSADVTMTEKVQPAVFKQIALIFDIRGNIEPEKALEAVRLSETKFCGVSAMLVGSVPISYRVVLNGQEIGEGRAQFDKENVS